MTALRGHLEDGTLLRVVDGQTLPDDRAGHLDTCEHCRARLAGLRDRSRTASAAVALVDRLAPAPPADLWERVLDATSREPSRGPRAPHAASGWTRRPLLRAAVVTGLLIAGALTAEPVRRWIVDVATDVAAVLGRTPGEPPSTPAAPAASGGGAVAVEIVPATTRLVVRVDAPETGGVVVVRFEERATARGEILGDDDRATLVALPDGFRVQNRRRADRETAPDEPRAPARYRFTVPRSLERVEVRVGGRSVAVLTPADAGYRGDVPVRIDGR